MERILIFIKHHVAFLWRIIDMANGALFSILYERKLSRVLFGVFSEVHEDCFSYRKLELKDMTALFDLIASQSHADLRYFNPHRFDQAALIKQCNKPAFLMMGVFNGQNLIGYFFLRFFFNGKCFVGRLIDKDYRGKGIGVIMNYIMYETSWRLGFRCLSTISRKNKAVMGAHAKNQTMQIIKELQNDYLLVEFVHKGAKG